MSDQLQIFSGKRILLEYYNRLNRKTIDLSEVDFGKPARIDTAGTEHNTVLRIYPKLGTKYYGSPRLYYDRIHISLLGNISVPKGLATKVWELIDAINEKYNVGITTDDVMNDDLQITAATDIVVNLRVNPESITFYDGQMIYTKNYPDPTSLPAPHVSAYGMWSVAFSSHSVVLTNDNYTALMNYEHTARCNMFVDRGICYWEITIDANDLLIGVATKDVLKDSTGVPVLGINPNSWVLNTKTGTIINSGNELPYCDPIQTGKTVGVLLNMSSGELSYVVDHINLGMAFSGLNLYSEIYPVITGVDGVLNSLGTANFGQANFIYSVPIGVTPGLFVTYEPVPASSLPPPLGGYGTTIPPAGTQLGEFCQDEDKWGVFADGVGGFNLLLVEAMSVACGYDPTNPFIISGGDAGD